MNVFFYFLIFVFKVTENTLSTLRIIVVANGMKLLGSILQGVIAAIWTFSTGLVVVDVLNDPFKIVAFTLGSLIGSYVGSLIEDKIALGSNMLTVSVCKKCGLNVAKSLGGIGYDVIVLDGKCKDDVRDVLFVMIKRRDRKRVIELIRSIDCDSTIIIENAFTYFSK